MPINLITNIATFPETHRFDWDDLPMKIVDVDDPASCEIPADPVTRRVGFKVSHPPTCTKIKQGKGAKWPGNFTNDDFIIYTDKRVGPISIIFENPIKGAGAQIQERFGISKIGGAPFMGIIRAFDINNNPLIPPSPPMSMPGSTFGKSNNAKDGSAIFVGLVSNAADIKSLEFDTRGLDPHDLDGDFAINTLLLVI